MTLSPIRERRRWRAGRVVAIALAGVVAMLTLVASPASAATPQCTTYVIREAKGYLPASSGYDTRCWMLRGNNSQGVYVLQQALVYCYDLYVGPNGPDGDFGGNTFAALKAVQRGAGITVDGGYGPQTYGVMHFWGPWEGCS